MKVHLKQVQYSIKHGKTLKSTPFKILGNPPHVRSFSKVVSDKRRRQLDE